ncbi:MAG: LamG domain-containing protein, partial [Sedimentisphaerales bacterium]
MLSRTISVVSLAILLGLAHASSADLVAYWDFEGGFDDAWGTNDATPHGDVAIVVDADRARVAELDGAGDYLEIPNSPALNITGSELTIAAWVYFDDVAGAPEIVIAKVFRESEHTSPYFSYGLHILSNGTPRFWLVTDGAAGNAPGTTNLGSGQWYHMAGVYDGSQMILYVDGEVAATTSKSGNITGYDTVLRLGINGGFTEPMAGRLDDVRIYNHALDQADLQAVMLQVGGGYPYAMGPSPGDGAVHEDTWATLSWRAGDFAVSHDVYLGDDFDDVNNATNASETFRGNQTATFYVAGFPGYAYPDGLVPGTTYYWRIDEVNDADPNSPWKGPVWSFSIPPKTAYNPNPSDGAEFVGPDNVTFTWTPGFGAKIHTVYLGDNYDDV